MKNLFAALLFSVLPFSASAVEVGEDGLHKQPWLETTFKDIHEDIETAREQDKRLLMIVEQRGCPFCKRLHETVLIDPEVVDYIENHYVVVQYNLHGAEEVTDLDGDALPENEVAQKWALKYTPTLLFMPDDADNTHSAIDQAVVALSGAKDRDALLSMLSWVVDRGYEGEESFDAFHLRRTAGGS